MEYKILNESSRENVRKELMERSKEWSVEQTQIALHNYRGELAKIEKEIEFKTMAIKLYKADPTIKSPVFNYESNLEYATMLRDMKIPEMEEELAQKLGQMESTVFQIPIMEELISTIIPERDEKAKAIEAIIEEVE